MTQVKKIHYIWLGGNKKSRLINKCIDSWKKHFPDWEIIEWNESNLDVRINKFCEEAYESKKYAFSSDVLRFKVLSDYGGIYFDTDVEVLKNFEDLVQQYEAFTGFESEYCNPGLVTFSSTAGNPIIKEMLNGYYDRTFINKDGTYNLKTVGQYFTEIMVEKGLKQEDTLQTVDGFTTFPRTYFCPNDVVWRFKEFTANTRTIHHFASSWMSKKERRGIRFKKVAHKVFGYELIQKYKNFPIYKYSVKLFHT